MSFINGDFTLLLTYGADGVPRLKELVGEENCARCRLPYAQPYEPFHGIRKIQRSLREASLQGPVELMALDLSEWLGHQSEEYFSILLKYLHDQREEIKYLFTLPGNSKQQAFEIFCSLRRFLKGELYEDKTLEDPKLLTEYLMEKGPMEEKAAQLLSQKVISHPSLEFCSYPAIDDLLSEVMACAKGERLTCKELNSYLKSPQCIFTLYDDRQFSCCREETFENEQL